VARGLALGENSISWSSRLPVPGLRTGTRAIEISGSIAGCDSVDSFDS
jgi:hypothetical protein